MNKKLKVSLAALALMILPVFQSVVSATGFIEETAFAGQMRSTLTDETVLNYTPLAPETLKAVYQIDQDTKVFEFIGEASLDRYYQYFEVINPDVGDHLKFKALHNNVLFEGYLRKTNLAAQGEPLYIYRGWLHGYDPEIEQP